MRVALCLSGQMRTYKQAYKNLKKYILKPLKPDVFIHTWEYSGITNRSKLSSKNKYGEKITYRQLKKLYNPKKAVIEKFYDEYYDELEGIKFPKKLKKDNPTKTYADLPLFYKIKKCNDLKKEYEEKHGFKYDIVIRMRPDLMIKEKIPGRVLNESSVIWLPHFFLDTSKFLNDRFAISNSENMDYYASLWDNLNKYWKEALKKIQDGEKCVYWLSEGLMKQHLDRGPAKYQVFDINVKIFFGKELLYERILRNIKLIPKRVKIIFREFFSGKERRKAILNKINKRKNYYIRITKQNFMKRKQ